MSTFKSFSDDLLEINKTYLHDLEEILIWSQSIGFIHFNQGGFVDSINKKLYSPGEMVGLFLKYKKAESKKRHKEAMEF